MIFLKKTIKNIYKRLLADQIKDHGFIVRLEALNNVTHTCETPGVTDEKYHDKDIIVSLTTYGDRLYEVYLTIESIMQQTMKPNRIVLWLEDSLKNADLPIVLKRQQERGLEIKYCEDLRSYKKLIPSLEAFPDDVIITIDDDNFYHFDLLENFINAFRKNPNLIYCSRAHKIKLKNKNKLRAYKHWIHNYQGQEASLLIFPTGSGGVLYPPGCLNKEVTNKKIFLDICRYADDVWFKAMALLNDTKARKVYSHKYGEFNNRNAQTSSLSEINIDKSMNDAQLKAVFDKYNLYEKLRGL